MLHTRVDRGLPFAITSWTHGTDPGRQRVYNSWQRLYVSDGVDLPCQGQWMGLHGLAGKGRSGVMWWMRIGLLLMAWPAIGALDLSRDVVAYSPAAEERSINLLKQIAARGLIVPLNSVKSEDFARQAKHSGIEVIGAFGADIRVADALVKARKFGLGGVAFEQPKDALEVREAATSNPDLLFLAYLKGEQWNWDVAPAVAVVKEGLWPGIHPVDTGSAGATEKPWVDANAYLYSYLRGMYPNRPALAGYRADKDAGLPPERSVRPSTVELAMAEAWSAGGNYILSLPPMYMEALLKGDSRASASWTQLGRTLEMLRAFREMYLVGAHSSIAIVAHDWEQAYELLNMSYRYNLFPRVIPENAIPLLTGQGLSVVAATGVKPSENGKASLEAFLRAGGALVLAPEDPQLPRWWRGFTAEKPAGGKDQAWSKVGAGRVLTYLDPVLDPAEFALDLIDALGEKPRDLRIWNASAVLGMVHKREGGKALLTLLNYGGMGRDILMVRIAGLYKSAVMRRAGGAAVPIEIKQRKTMTEFTLQGLESVALIEFE